MPWHFPKNPNSAAGRSTCHVSWGALAAFAIGAACATPAMAEQSFDCVIDPSEVVKLGSPLTGVLSDVMVNRGDAVTRGEPIATLESTIEAATVKLNRFKAESTAKEDAQNERLKLAQSRVERYGNPRGLVVTQDKFEEISAEEKVAEQDLLREQQDRKLAQLELERSQAALDQRTIRSTIDGIVTEKKLSAGEFVNQEGYIVQLARLDPLFVEVYLPVVYYKDVQVGMQVNVHPAPPVEQTFSATVSVVDHVFDPASGTFGVRLTLPNPNNALPGGQRCKITFDFDKAPTPVDR
jgi:RND family efflux transporter MFP subunit